MRFAVGSLLEQVGNKVRTSSFAGTLGCSYCFMQVEIYQMDEKDACRKAAEFEHPYPATKIMFMPDKVVR